MTRCTCGMELDQGGRVRFAAERYKRAIAAQDTARRDLIDALRTAKAQGRPVRGEDGLAAELGVSVARVYQLLEKEQ